ncbi:hypothetical protein EV646_104209 [Kribbella antiqua]|uniref:Uncharacterized protein n=1 Tax=Kribbella antiqua TaxID=2512217 RepID=A0A4R2ISC2_9ACTN|nr:hypothetical protein [Kribbella antiqua]TCO48391.1 hypothetical protein EV646_104209 [Kribbella antiqua]
MSTETARRSAVPASDPVTRKRIGLVSLIFVITSVAAVPGGLLWPEPSGGGETYTYADIQPLRDRWWGLLVVLSANLVLNVPAQALLTVFLVCHRGAPWATIGGLVMWIGTALYAVGVAGWAATYYFATGVDAATGGAVMDHVADDTPHLLGTVMAGALMVAVGTVIQVIGLWRSHAVPRWIPVLLLVIVVTFVIPGSGWIGLITAVPMTAGAVGLAYYAWRRTGTAVE